jgi:hypothetical protein
MYDKRWPLARIPVEVKNCKCTTGRIGNVKINAIDPCTPSQETLMSASYQHIPLAELKPGMVLADVLLDQQGQVLLAQGAVLNETTIALMPRHGIATLPIAVPGTPTTPVDRATLAQRIDHLFRRNDIDDQDDWATGTLRRYVENYRLPQEADQ